MTWWRWRGGMLRQIRFWFLILLTLNQVALLACLYVLLVRPAAESFSAVSLGLVDATLKHQSRNTRTLGLIHDHWESPGHIIVTSVPPQNLEPVPLFPGLRAVEALVHSTWGNKIKVGFSREPERMVWFQYQDGERFSVGIPMDQRMLGLVFLVAAVLLIFVLSGAASWAVAVRLTRPLDELSNTALRLGHGEDVGEISASRSAPAEIIRLANALNQMRGEINQMTQERERFLSGIAHDLRTPLSRMRVSLELSDTRDDELTEGLREDIDEMRTILDQFIELSRLDTEKSEPSEMGDVNAVVSDIEEKYRRAGEVLQLSLGEVMPIFYKPVALKRLLYNLIDNALRYGRDPVVVATGMNEQGVWLSVTNQESETTRDSVLVSALAWAAGGQHSGLGLAISRRLAEVHEAGLTVAQNPPGVRKVHIQFKGACNNL
ncbi:MAG: histidine kinase dimerization/phospho-acceptor domain-containing protein [Fluviibacter phosphoraccumulans]